MDADNLNATKRATLVEVPLVNEPATDKGFECAEDSRVYRVRVTPVDIAPTVSGLPIASLIAAFDITITALNGDGSVMSNGEGQAVIMAHTRWTVDTATFSTDNPENTAQATLMRLIEQKVYEAVQVARAQTDLADVMVAWGAISS